MKRPTWSPWETIARAATPALALSELVRRLARDAGASRLRIGVVAGSPPMLRWVETSGPRTEPGSAIGYLSAAEAERLETYLRRHPATRAAADALPRPLAPLAPREPGEGELVVVALPRSEGGHGLAIATVASRAGAAAARQLEDAIEPLAVALDRALAPRDESASPAARAAAAAAPATSSAATDRDGLSDKIIGADRGLRAVMLRVSQVCRSDVPVLILGETGSGKEVVARALHAGSPRADEAFIRVNCGAIPPELIDSELFGHERGAFTGASGQRRGWFEQADGGSLFLDEIGELPLAAQVRLLRILQEGAFHRVGGERTVRVDVRVIAATHRDLSAMIEDGRFREDLWYRLDVFPIRLPPLREHPEDIPAMVEHFARRAAARFGVAARTPTADDLARLMAYAWPGNVRELGAVIDRAVLLGDGDRLEIAKALGEAPSRERRESAPPPRSPGPPGSSARDPEPDTGPGPGGAPLASLDDALRRHIEDALHRCHGRVDGRHGAARLLAINPHTLRGKMRRLGIAPRAFRAGGERHRP